MDSNCNMDLEWLHMYIHIIRKGLRVVEPCVWRVAECRVDAGARVCKVVMGASSHGVMGPSGPSVSLSTVLSHPAPINYITSKVISTLYLTRTGPLARQMSYYRLQIVRNPMWNYTPPAPTSSPTHGRKCDHRNCN